MAVDEALATAPDVPVLRIYGWDRPTVTFGYFEKFVAVRQSRPGHPLTRRWTGGGIVDHGTDWTYSLIVPAHHSFARISVAESYRQLHTAIAMFLQNHGHAVTLAQAESPAGEGCFQRPVVADVVVGHRKIAGGAQRRTRRALLHQGSVQNVDASQWTAEAFARHFSRKIACRNFSVAEIATADQLTETRYASESWLMRF